MIFWRLARMGAIRSCIATTHLTFSGYGKFRHEALSLRFSYEEAGNALILMPSINATFQLSRNEPRCLSGCPYLRCLLRGKLKPVADPLLVQSERRWQQDVRQKVLWLGGRGVVFGQRTMGEVREFVNS